VTLVDDARRHFADADWESAREVFAAALREDPDDPDALDGLGQSLWWLGARDEAIATRREAYLAYRRLGDSRNAGRVATYIAAEERIAGRTASSSGWLARARRLLDGIGVCSEAGWLEVEEAKAAPDAVATEEHARVALAVAHELGDNDVECLALSHLGRAAIAQGRVDEGVTYLDEAMMIALGGETTDPIAASETCCTTLVTCDALADLRRSTEWCEAVVEFADRRRFTPVHSWCRSIYAGVLIRGGDWERAERVLTDALRYEADPRRGGGRTLPLATLAELRLRQGRAEEASSLLGGLDDDAAPAQRVGLALQRGELERARALLERLGPRRYEADALILRAEVARAAADGAESRAAAEALSAVAESLDRDDLRAAAAHARGDAESASGEDAAAVAALDEAVAGFSVLGYPLEEGRARLTLARVLHRLDSPLAVDAARQARDGFERLGARADADRAAALLRELGGSGRTTVRVDAGALTARETEVLHLLADGLSNAEIARRLVISPKTAEHHVSRVLAKLGVRTRAEAAAHAVREGL
jgi:DNA-binding NarL/FixJ family response regulator